jgi:hypothetical protein
MLGRRTSVVEWRDQPIAMTRPGNPDETPPSALAGRRGTLVPPPPSTTLLAHIAKMQAVRPSVPARSLLIVALVAWIYPAWALTALPLRHDLGALPIAWVVGVGALWLAGFILPLTFAIQPRTGHVVPDGERAFWTACLTAAVLIGASLLLGVETFGSRRVSIPGSAALLRASRGCATTGLRVSVPVIVAGTLALRRVAILDSWRLGAAVGVAGGSLAGLTLHLGCPNGHPAHVALAHGGGVVIGAVVGALFLFLAERTNR